MRRESRDPLILSGLDIGTRKISFVVTETDPASFEMQVILISSARSRGVTKGDILDPDLCVESIREVIDESESSLGLHVNETVISFGPSQTESFRLDQTIMLHEEGAPDRPITSGDMKNAVAASITAAKTRSEDFLLHAMPLGFSVDGGYPTSDPRGQRGSDLTVSLLAVFVPEKSVMAAIECAEKAGLKVNGIIHKSISTAFGSLFPEEMKKGAVAVDVGAGTTSAAFCIDGFIQGIAHFPIGGNHITKDIAKVLGIPFTKAEYLKREVSLTEDDDSIQDELEFEMEGKTFATSVEEVLNIISPRVDEMLGYFFKPWINGLDAAGSVETIVFSGGVSASPGFNDVVGEFFQSHTRMGLPVGMSCLPPQGKGSQFVSSIGIFNYLCARDENPGFYLEPSFKEMVEENEISGRTERSTMNSQKTGHPFRAQNRENGFFVKIIRELKHAFRELF